jgi:hypothetical protein
MCIEVIIIKIFFTYFSDALGQGKKCATFCNSEYVTKERYIHIVRTTTNTFVTSIELAE